MMIAATMLVMALTSTHYLNAQNVTTNSSYTAGSLMDSVNQSTSELGQDASIVLNKAGEEVSSTINQLGQNMSNVGSEIINETEETAKNVGLGAADVLSNISGEIKEGISGK